MAKLTYLQLVNRVLSRITQTDLSSSASTATGQAGIIADYINEAQNMLLGEGDWYSLYETRKWDTVSYTSAGDIAFVEGGGSADTITDDQSGFVTAGLVAGQDVLVSGSSSNDGVYTIDTVAAGTLTLQTADDLTNETGDTGAVSVTAITYATTSDWARTLDLVNKSDTRVLIEDYDKSLDMDDPDFDNRGTPTHFSLQGTFYRIHPIPSGTTTMRERYIKMPTVLSGDSDTSDLPIELENCIIYYALVGILEYQNKMEHADRIRIKFERQLKSAFAANKKKINKTFRFNPYDGGVEGITHISPAKLPSTHPRGW